MHYEAIAPLQHPCGIVGLYALLKHAEAAPLTLYAQHHGRNKTMGEPVKEVALKEDMPQGTIDDALLCSREMCQERCFLHGEYGEEIMLQPCQAQLLAVEGLPHRQRHAVSSLIDARQRTCEIIYKVCRCRRGGLDADACHLVEHALIALMAYARDDRQGEVGHILRKVEGVEAREVGGAATTAYYHHHIETVHLFEDGIEGADDALLHLLALHDGGEESRGEGEALLIVGQLVREVAISRCGRAGDDGDALGKGRDGQRRVIVYHAPPTQLLQDFLTATRHITNGERGVDVLHYPREAILLMEIGLHLQQHLHAGMERLTRSPDEPWRETHPAIGPATGTGLRYGGVAEVVFLHKFHIAMAATLAEAGNLGQDPQRVGKSYLYGLTDKVVGFMKGEVHVGGQVKSYKFQVSSLMLKA